MATSVPPGTAEEEDKAPAPANCGSDTSSSSKSTSVNRGKDSLEWSWVEVSQETHVNDPNAYIRERIWRAGRSLHPPSSEHQTRDVGGFASSYSSDDESDCGSVLVIEAPAAARRAAIPDMNNDLFASPAAAILNNLDPQSIGRLADLKEYDYTMSSRTSTPLSATSTLASEILSKAFMSDTDSLHSISNPPSPVDSDRSSKMASHGGGTPSPVGHRDGNKSEGGSDLRPGEKSLGRARRKHKKRSPLLAPTDQKALHSNCHSSPSFSVPYPSSLSAWTTWLRQSIDTVPKDSWPRNILRAVGYMTIGLLGLKFVSISFRKIHQYIMRLR